VLIRRTLRPGKAFAVFDADLPGEGALAAAYSSAGRWQIVIAGGRMVGETPHPNSAVLKLMQAARRQADTRALRAFRASSAEVA
jgi:hypothetical protein